MRGIIVVAAMLAACTHARYVSTGGIRTGHTAEGSANDCASALGRATAKLRGDEFAGWVTMEDTKPGLHGVGYAATALTAISIGIYTADNDDAGAGLAIAAGVGALGSLVFHGIADLTPTCRVTIEAVRPRPPTVSHAATPAGP